MVEYTKVGSKDDETVVNQCGRETGGEKPADDIKIAGEISPSGGMEKWERMSLDVVFQ
ncbi:hypothetical protein KSMBR1_1045 [Candidatus Kuenenia stuttgartiensis]|uniref:Uncharacterized protein n=1 Tax=Kuenenia stuttgartiensis TaxID=174633 RepID=A0A2C9CD86_KUEST|nr:hypothetical protein KSMBR1_1045 [Candidatus Kuenenia stuttgartiensis]